MDVNANEGLKLCENKKKSGEGGQVREDVNEELKFCKNAKKIGGGGGGGGVGL